MGNNCCVVSTPRKPQFASCPRYSAVDQSPIIGRIVAGGLPEQQVTQRQPQTKWSNGELYQAVTGALEGSIDPTNGAQRSTGDRVEPLRNSLGFGDVAGDCVQQQGGTALRESSACAEQTQKRGFVLDRVSRSQEELDDSGGRGATPGGGLCKSLGSLGRLEVGSVMESPRHSSASALLRGPNQSSKGEKADENRTATPVSGAQVPTSVYPENRASKTSVLHEGPPLANVPNPSKETGSNSSERDSCPRDRSSLSLPSVTSSGRRQSSRVSSRLSTALESGRDSAAVESGADSCGQECSSESGLLSPVTYKSRSSFRLVRDLEVPDPEVVQNKDLKQLIEAFVKDNSLMRKPCKEFLDRASYKRAKLEHHLSLVSTVKGVDVCSLSCASVTSSRTVNEQSTLDLQSTPPKSAIRSSAKKNLNFERMSSTSKRPKSSSSSRSDSARLELFNLEDFLETGSEAQRESDAERSSNFGGAALPPTRHAALDESFSSNGFKNSSPGKFSSSPRNSKAWDAGQDYGGDQRSEKKNDSSAREEDTSYKEPSYINGWDDPLDAETGDCGGKEDKENSPPNSIGTSKFKKTAGNFEDCFDGVDNETSFRSCRRSRSSVSSLKESSPLSKMNTLNVIDNFPSFECDDQYSNNRDRAFSTPKKKKNDAVSTYESPSRDCLDENFSVFNSCLNSSKVSDNSYKAKSSFKNDSFTNNVRNDETFNKSDTYNGFGNGFDAKSNDGDWPKLCDDDSYKNSPGVGDSGDPQPTCLFGDDDRETTSRLNISSSSQRSLRRASPAFGRPFATLSGISPTYKKRNSFKFDEDPRFGCNSSRNSDNCQSEYDAQDSLVLGGKGETDHGSPQQAKKNRQVHTVNDSHDFGNEDLFGFPADEESLDDPFSTSGDQNGSEARGSKEDGEQRDDSEGPSLRLNKHVKLSKKGISLGAMGCELSIGKNVELNIFGKKTATLV